jgi:KaiC/GvpD/RAD55 family RecA-like ATPase
VDDGKLAIEDMNALFKQLGIEHPDTGLSRDDAHKLLEAIVEAVDGVGAKTLVIDSLTSVLAAFDVQSGMRTFVKDLVRTFSEKGVTVYLTSELAPDSLRYSSMGIEDAIVDGVILLSNIDSRGDLLRGLQIIKMRGTQHSRSRYVFDLTVYGMTIVPVLKSYTKGGGD